MNVFAKLELRQAEADARQALAAVRAQLQKVGTDPALIAAVENHITRDRAPSKPSAAPRPQARPAPRPAPVATAPAPAPAQSGFITAEEFQGPPPPRMLKSEFDKMKDSDRSKFIREGGKLVADPKPARR